MNPETSIVMCAFNRAGLLRKTLESIYAQSYKDFEVVCVEDGDDGGWTRGVCGEFGARYFQRKNRPDQPYSNPAIPWNVGIRNAIGDVLILQNPECLHITTDVIEKLVIPHRTDNRTVAFASVLAMRKDGSIDGWYCHPTHSARPFFFCGSLRREVAHALRGFDEDFGRGVGGYGFDDDHFALRLQVYGCQFKFFPESEVLVHHMAHDKAHCYGLQSNEELFRKKMEQLASGQIGVAANAENDWGRGNE